MLPAEDDSQPLVFWDDTCELLLSTGLLLSSPAVGLTLNARLRAEPPRTLCSSMPGMAAGGGRRLGESRARAP